MDGQEIEAMRLDEFARASLVVPVASDVLGSTVLFVSDTILDEDLEDEEMAVYRPDELLHLDSIDVSPKLLRAVNSVKTVFGGTISGVRASPERSVEEPAPDPEEDPR